VRGGEGRSGDGAARGWEGRRHLEDDGAAAHGEHEEGDADDGVEGAHGDRERVARPRPEVLPRQEGLRAKGPAATGGGGNSEGYLYVQTAECTLIDFEGIARQ
jgi:hypothetical protein